MSGYVERGLPDTLHDNDLLAAQPDPAHFIVRVQRMPDGAMLASKTLALQSVHEGHTARALHENATSRSSPHVPQ